MLVVTNLRRKSAHALTFGGNFELKFRACANSHCKICDNQPANLCTNFDTKNLSGSDLVTFDL